ncbi:hypothetical protein DJ66_1176 [Candidatus Liberibacter solanacearum]|uniref:Uncharacterized protein n=1 Tax=Candidatus Liberibacter solanacearum TaxID=556287 RepID=A0A0F4VJ12_9HYPH|nr:hypothetical protein [Candidatus Liberibacter solanacearum]KJZ80677.1 hypothetical protein KP07_05300 [Candidatus Liberibacter solanacearum]KJZ81498.1 hypothetical protein DJ66_1176 [Candidatus Liberibacter solanacearum]
MGIFDTIKNNEKTAASLIGGVASLGLSLLAKSGEGKAQAKDYEYRASLAEENAKRADVLYLEREEQARREGLFDAGLFRMKAEMSGLSGASLDMWVGQRYHDAYKGVVNARTTREQTVSRFMKEAGWHRDNKGATDSSTFWSKAAIGLSGATKVGLDDLYEKWKS